jgi:hypothetical protein
VEALERGSITTASVYFRKASYACEELKTTPKELVTMDTKQVKFFLHDLITHFESDIITGLSACLDVSLPLNQSARSRFGDEQVL